MTIASTIAEIGQGARGRGNLPCAGHADYFDVAAHCAAAQQGIQRALQQALGNHRIPARDDNGELHSFGGEIAFNGDWLAPLRIGPGPEAESKSRLRLDGKDAATSNVSR